MELFKQGPQESGAYTKRIYAQIIFLSLLIHVSYTAIFAFLSYWLPCAYNALSIGYYVLVLLFVVRKERFKLAVALAHLEVCVFVVVCTVNAGWGLGIQLFLIALSSLVYFCPYERKYITYLFALGEIVLFMLLRVFSAEGIGQYPPLAAPVETGVYIYSAGLSFAIILYAAFVSGLSAAVGKKELKDENELLSTLANYDTLTGLLSRHAILQKLDECEDEAYFLAMGDIDDFKRVNDTYGHVSGDEVLSRVGMIMRECAKGKAEVCRWGGEEFLLLVHASSMECVRVLIQGICNKVAAAEFLFQGTRLHVTMTFGVAQREIGEDMDHLIAQADERLYYGKKRGKNCVVTEHRSGDRIWEQEDEARQAAPSKEKPAANDHNV